MFRWLSNSSQSNVQIALKLNSPVVKKRPKVLKIKRSERQHQPFQEQGDQGSPLVLFVKKTGFAFSSVAIYIAKSRAADFNRNKPVEMLKSIAGSLSFLSEMFRVDVVSFAGDGDRDTIA
jgi:hypothetical protein